MRLRKQKEVQKENEFYMQLLQQALPPEQQMLQRLEREAEEGEPLAQRNDARHTDRASGIQSSMSACRAHFSKEQLPFHKPADFCSLQRNKWLINI